MVLASRPSTTITVHLDRVWINLASDLTQAVVARSYQSSDDQTVNGTVVATADGGFRSIVQAGGTAPIKKTLRLVPPADVATLRSWLGQTVLVRDKFGRRAWCVYYDTPTVLTAKTGEADVTMTFQQVSHVEAV